MALKLAILVEPDSPHIDNYLQAASLVRGVEEVAVSGDAFVKRVKPMAGAALKKWAAFPDSRAVIAQFRPDVAVVSYPARRAPEVIAAALEANCHVIAEKPACVRSADFRQLARTADSKHRQLMLALANRTHGMMQTARTLVADGAIGRPYAAHLLLVADQTRLKSLSYQKSWVARKEEAMGGFLSWLSIHYLDMLMFLTRERFAEVSAMSRNANRLPIDVEDSIAATLAMTGGLIATLHGGYYLNRGYQSGCQLWGADGWLRMNLHGMGARSMEWCSYASGRVESLSWPDDVGAYNLFVQAAVDSAAANSPALITPAEGLHLLETIEAAYNAAEHGHRQKIV